MDKKPKWMIIYLIVIWCVTAVCVITGITLRITSHWPNAVGKVVDFGDTIEYEQELEAFSSIQIDVSIADVEIDGGRNFKISYEMPEDITPGFYVEEGTLYISQAPQDTGLGAAAGGRIEVTVPKDCNLDSVTCAVDLGKIEIEKIKAGTVNLTTDLGEIEAEKVSCVNLVCLDSYGDIDIEDCTFNKGKCTDDLGSIEVSGDFSALEAHCDLGSIEVVTKRDREDVDLNLTTDLGTITVNGKEE